MALGDLPSASASGPDRRSPESEPSVHVVSMVGILVGAVLGMVLVAASGSLTSMLSSLAMRTDALVSYTGRVLHSYRLDRKRWSSPSKPCSDGGVRVLLLARCSMALHRRASCAVLYTGKRTSARKRLVYEG